MYEKGTMMRNTHNTTRWTLFPCLLLCLLLAWAAHAAPAAPMRVIYGFDREYPPFSFEDPGGKATGFDVELMQAVFAGQANLVTRPIQWDMIPVELSSGAVTVTTGMVRTQQRGKIYSFSQTPTLLVPIYIFTKDYKRFPNESFLRGQRVSVEAGSYQHRLLEHFGGINIKPFKGKIPPLKALHTDEVEGYCAPLQPAQYYLKKLNYTAINTMGSPLGIVEMRVAVTRDRGDIAKMVDVGLERVHKTGEYDRIYRKWFVKDLTPEQQEKLIAAAKEALLTAYAPYSKKGMGAALLTGTGRIYNGSTVENAEPRCNSGAVASALAKTLGAGDMDIRAAVLVNEKGAIVTPEDIDCQTLYEFGRGILVIGESKTGQRTLNMLADLLPNPVTAPTPPLQVE